MLPETIAPRNATEEELVAAFADASPVTHLVFDDLLKRAFAEELFGDLPRLDQICGARSDGTKMTSRLP